MRKLLAKILIFCLALNIASTTLVTSANEEKVRHDETLKLKIDKNKFFENNIKLNTTGDIVLEVSTYEEFVQALENTNVATINLLKDITLKSDNIININRSLTINGNNRKIDYGDYKSSINILGNDIVIKNLKIVAKDIEDNMFYLSSAQNITLENLDFNIEGEQKYDLISISMCKNITIGMVEATFNSYYQNIMDFTNSDGITVNKIKVFLYNEDEKAMFNGEVKINMSLCSNINMSLEKVDGEDNKYSNYRVMINLRDCYGNIDIAFNGKKSKRAYNFLDITNTLKDIKPSNINISSNANDELVKHSFTDLEKEYISFVADSNENILFKQQMKSTAQLKWNSFIKNKDYSSFTSFCNSIDKMNNLFGKNYEQFLFTEAEKKSMESIYENIGLNNFIWKNKYNQNGIIEILDKNKNQHITMFESGFDSIEILNSLYKNNITATLCNNGDIRSLNNTARDNNSWGLFIDNPSIFKDIVDNNCILGAKVTFVNSKEINISLESSLNELLKDKGYTIGFKVIDLEQFKGKNFDLYGIKNEAKTYIEQLKYSSNGVVEFKCDGNYESYSIEAKDEIVSIDSLNNFNIEYDKSWNVGGYNASTNSMGSVMEYEFIGTGIRWIAAKSWLSGKAKVYIDDVYFGIVNNFDYYNTVESVFEKNDLEYGKHKIRIESIGGDYGFNNSIVSQGFDVIRDRNKVEFIDSSSSKISKIGTWNSEKSYLYIGGDEIVSNIQGSKLEFEFEGTGIRLIGSYEYHILNGQMKITIDGVSELVNSTTSSYKNINNTILFEKNGLDKGKHNVSIEVIKGGNSNFPIVSSVRFDYAEVLKEYSINADLDNNGAVDILDLALLSKKYNTYSNQDNWNEKYDTNFDGVIDIYDLVYIAHRIN